MARMKTPSEAVRVRFALAGRIAALRSEMFGERGGADMARRLGLPLRTWYNYEEGTAIPAEVILTIMELTSAEPRWLLYGTGPKYRPKRAEKGDERSPIKLADPTGLQVLKKCRVSGRRHFCHPTSFQGRGCENGRSTEDPASGS